MQGVATRPSFPGSCDSRSVLSCLFSVWKVKDFFVCVCIKSINI